MTGKKKTDKAEPKKPEAEESAVSWVDVVLPAAVVALPGAEALGLLGEDGLGLDLGLDDLGDALDDALGLDE